MCKGWSSHCHTEQGRDQGLAPGAATGQSCWPGTRHPPEARPQLRAGRAWVSPLESWDPWPAFTQIPLAAGFPLWKFMLRNYSYKDTVTLFKNVHCKVVWNSIKLTKKLQRFTRWKYQKAMRSSLESVAVPLNMSTEKAPFLWEDKAQQPHRAGAALLVAVFGRQHGGTPHPPLWSSVSESAWCVTLWYTCN